MPSQVPVFFRQALLTRLVEYGYPNVLVIEARQANKQGRIDDGIYWRLMNPKNYGWQARRYDYINGKGHTEHQLVEATIKLSCFVHDDYATGYDSSDLASITQMSVNSLPFVEELKRNNIGVQRATPIRTIDFTDEADNYATESSFDVNVTFMRSINPLTPAVDILQPTIMRV